jgi:hypothetical protein
MQFIVLGFQINQQRAIFSRLTIQVISMLVVVQNCRQVNSVHSAVTNKHTRPYIQRYGVVSTSLGNIGDCERATKAKQ